MDIRQHFGMNRETCENGARFPFGDGTLIVASMYSRRYQLAKASVDLDVRLRAESKEPDYTEEELHQIDCRLAATALLLGWENIQDDGADVAPTPENREKFLYDVPPLLVTVKHCARQFAPYGLAHDEAATKNSEGSSPGNSGGDQKSDGSPVSPAEGS